MMSAPECAFASSMAATSVQTLPAVAQTLSPGDASCASPGSSTTKVVAFARRDATIRKGRARSASVRIETIPPARLYVDAPGDAQAGSHRTPHDVPCERNGPLRHLVGSTDHTAEISVDFARGIARVAIRRRLRPRAACTSGARVRLGQWLRPRRQPPHWQDHHGHPEGMVDRIASTARRPAFETDELRVQAGNIEQLEVARVRKRLCPDWPTGSLSHPNSANCVAMFVATGLPMG